MFFHYLGGHVFGGWYTLGVVSWSPLTAYTLLTPARCCAGSPDRFGASPGAPFFGSSSWRGEESNLQQEGNSSPVNQSPPEDVVFTCPRKEHEEKDEILVVFSYIKWDLKFLVMKFRNAPSPTLSMNCPVEKKIASKIFITTLRNPQTKPMKMSTVLLQRTLSF